MDIRHAARVELLQLLASSGYRFVTPTPASHRRVIGRPGMETASSVRDALGWSLPFPRETLPAPLFEALKRADALAPAGDLWKAKVRVSSLDEDLFLHSSFPPSDSDAVFFGPDTYRFAAFLREALAGVESPRLAVDVGAGSGAGAVRVARLASLARLVLTDINEKAQALAAANLAAAGIEAEFRICDGLDGVDEPLDLIVANPPYIAGDGGRTYRDGGDMHGARLSLDWALDGARRLTPGGRMLLYTGSAIVRGQDPFKAALASRLDDRKMRLAYRELDPDVFGELLTTDAYRDVDRIAAVGVVIQRLA